jgi:hypothetical protein
MEAAVGKAGVSFHEWSDKDVRAYRICYPCEYSIQNVHNMKGC